MPMVQSLTKNKRFVVRKVHRKRGPRDDDSDTSPFPDYIEQKGGLYHCLLCKDRTLEKHMWLSKGGMYQHHKRGTRHKQSVRQWLAAKAKGVQLSAYVRRGYENSTCSSAMDASEIDEEQSEHEDSVEAEAPTPKPVTEEPGIPILYYPTTSWDEPVDQGVQVVFNNSQAVDREPDIQEPLIAPEVRKVAVKWNGSSQGCVYSSTKTNGYYTCIWCNLPDTPQRKYRRCKRAQKALAEKSMQAVEDSPEQDYMDLPSYQLLYPSF